MSWYWCLGFIMPWSLTDFHILGELENLLVVVTCCCTCINLWIYTGNKVCFCVMINLRCFISSLAVARMELSSVSAPCTVLHFRFVAKTVLITQQCFGCCWTVLAHCQHALFFPLCPQQVSCEWARSYESAELGQLTQTGQRNIPHHISCSEIKT